MFFLFPSSPYLDPMCISFKNVLKCHLSIIFPPALSPGRFPVHISNIILTIIYYDLFPFMYGPLILTCISSFADLGREAPSHLFFYLLGNCFTQSNHLICLLNKLINEGKWGTPCLQKNVLFHIFLRQYFIFPFVDF